MAEVSPYDLNQTPLPYAAPPSFSLPSLGATGPGGTVAKGDNLWSSFNLDGSQPYSATGQNNSGNNQDIQPNYAGFYDDANGTTDSPFLRSLGWTGGDAYHSSVGLGQTMGNESGQLESGAYEGYTPDFKDWFGNSGLTLQQRGRTDKLGNNEIRAVDASGNQVGDTYSKYLGNDDGFGVAVALASLFAGGAAGAFGAGSMGAPAADSSLGAFEGIGSGVGGSGASAEGGLGAANGSWDIPGGFESDAWDNFGSMGGGGGGAGSWYEPAAGTGAGSSWLKDLYNGAKSLIPKSGGSGGSGGSSGAMGPFSGGMSPGDRYRQQLAAQAIRELGQKEPGFQSVWSGPPQ